MAPISEQTIERYLRCPETLPDEIRQQIEARLATDEEARQMMAFYRAFFDELDATGPEASPAIDHLLDRLFPPDA